ncbi:MAG: (d)CMP kinase [Negativicutes bacterium]|nr:(d)CMP kinase [Negativicutes bacterium]
MTQKLTIAIDGPAGAGKSTVAQIVARRLGYIYLDTGAMYRAVTWKAISCGLTSNAAMEIIAIAETIDLRLAYIDGKTRVFVDDTEVTGDIRSPEVTGMVSAVAQIAGVREAMTRLLRELARDGGVVLDGRDIGTYVLPDADIKIFLTASIEERAKRRWLELKEKGYAVDLEQLKDDIRCRDDMDCKRELAPLVRAKDAVLVDTTELSIEGAVQTILKLCEEKTRRV